MYRRMDILSGVKQVLYDICSNSCCLYVGPLAEHQQCSIWHAPRFHSNGKPITQFSYIPIIPRFQAWYGSLPMIDRLKYRSEQVHNETEIRDVFDDSNYQELLQSDVILDGTRLPHKYFSDPRDIVFGGSTDGFQVSLSINGKIWGCWAWWTGSGQQAASQRVGSYKAVWSAVSAV
jgi:hypothetical protein